MDEIFCPNVGHLRPENSDNLRLFSGLNNVEEDEYRRQEGYSV